MSKRTTLFPNWAPALTAVALCTLTMGAATAATYSQVNMVRVTDYLQSGDNNDWGKAINRAVADVTKPTLTGGGANPNYSKTIYFPAQTYTVSTKVLAQEQDRGSAECKGDHRGFGAVVMVGETNGASRPVIQAAKGKFGSGAIVVEIKNRTSESCAFRNGFRGIDINVGENANAVGLKFDAAQDSFLEDVKVTNGSTGKGIIAVPGRNMAATNIEVVGGNFGMELKDSSLGTVLVGVKLTGQKDTALYSNLYRGFAAVGLEIDVPSTSSSFKQAIKLEGGTGSGYPGHMSLYDASITFNNTSTNRIAISNLNKRAVILHNVYTKNATKIVQFNTSNQANNPDLPTTNMAANAAAQVVAFMRGPRGISVSNIGTIDAAYRIQNVTTTSTNSSPNDPAAIMGSTVALTATEKEALRKKHVWDKTLSFSDTDVMLPDFSTAPPGFNPAVDDSQPYLQASINAASANNQTLYLPAGVYAVSGPLELKGNTRLLGVPGMRSVLKPVNWTSPIPFMITTVNEADATTVLQDISMDTPTDSAGLALGGVHWQVGRYSMVRRIRAGLEASHYEKNFTEYLIDGHGGGRWYSLANHMNVPNDPFPNNGVPEEVDVPIHCDYRKVVISGTEQPLTFYGLNIERGGNKKQRTQYTFAEMRSAKNVRVFGQKMELDGSIVAATNNACDTTGTRADQPTDKPLGWDISGTTDNVFLTMIFINPTPTPTSTVAPFFRVGPDATRVVFAGMHVQDKSTTRKMLVDQPPGGGAEAVIDRRKWLTLYSREITNTTINPVDHTQFVHKP